MYKRSLLFAILATLAAFPAASLAGEPAVLPVPQTISDDLLRQTAINIALQNQNESSRSVFTTSDSNRLTFMGRFPLKEDGRHATMKIGNDWSLGWTSDQYGRSIGFSRPLGNHGVVRFGLAREYIPNIPNKTAAGLSLSIRF